MASSQDPQPVQAAEALEHLGRLSLRDLSMEDLLQTVADLAKTVVPGDTETSVSLLVRDRPTTVVSTGRLAVDADEAQYERDHGPCLHAARTGEVVEIADTRTDRRWPDYVPRAAERGVLSSLSVPLLIAVDEQVSGALNVYARQPSAFDADAWAAATRFGPYAAVAVGNLHAYRSAHTKADDLQAALESRATIDQAKGVLIERFGLTPDQAFQLLTRVSVHANRKVRHIADQLVHTGELQAVPARGGGRTSRLTGEPPSAPPKRRPARTAPAERDSAGGEYG
ncbi:AmiR/NasT family two-component response regulator [Geodermatophilus normandii]|uniref:AmiR/NasT family two-component response regulator n=1 Tax=Geodermatophilus normandii TaxID=1137989 RepID=A0A317QNB9_9ACTN|nr:GAF and ANTAR domain-containing protein [Geodermatophilus normandii]PWW25068.1 AmiR/NasT family two-component response regulator [Geodermatophilus normandii]